MVSGSPSKKKKKRERKEEETLFEKTIIERVLNLGKETNIHVQKLQRVPNDIDQGDPL